MKKRGKMRRTTYGMLALLISAMSMLTACAGEETRESSTEEAEGNIVLEVYAWEDERNSLTAIAEAYSEQTAGVTVHVNFIPAAEYSQGMKIALNGQSTPVDVFCLSAPYAAWTYVDNDYVMPLELSETDVSGYGDWYRIQVEDETQYMLPYRTSTWVVYYNKKLFDEAGVAYPSEGWTWQDYAEIAGLLTDTEAELPVYGSMSYDPSSTWWRVPARVKGAEDATVPEQLEEILQAAKWNYELAYEQGVQQSYQELTSVSSQDYSQRFADGRVAMMYNGEWCLPMLNHIISEDGVELDYDIAPLPVWEKGENYAIGTPAVMLLTKKSRHPEQAYQFMKFACGEEGAKIMAALNCLPAWDSQEVRETFLDNAVAPAHLQYLFSDREVVDISHISNYMQNLEIMKAEVQKYFMQEQDFETMAANVRRKIQESEAE